MFSNFWSSKPWIRIRIDVQPEMLDPDAESMNPDPIQPTRKMSDLRWQKTIRIRDKRNKKNIDSVPCPGGLDLDVVHVDHLKNYTIFMGIFHH
jgi:hypothetical protein